MHLHPYFFTGEIMTKEALRLALEAFGEIAWSNNTQWQSDRAKVAITAIKAALEAKDEPVAWMFEYTDKRVKPKFDSAPHGGNWQPLYTNLPTTSLQQPDAYGYARRLADAIWKKHYKSTAPQWEPFDNLIGVLTQIDNMTSGLTARQEKQEPVAWRWETHNGYAYSEQHYEGEDGQPLYTTPQQRTWVGLTDEEIDDIPLRQPNGYAGFARAIEAKLKEKNT